MLNDLILRRWTPEILLGLAPGPLNFNRLLAIKGISDRMLFVRLNELLDAGLVAREVRVISPIRVLYALTPSGRRYIDPLQQLVAIADESKEVAGIAS